MSEPTAGRANHHQLMALATDFYNRANGDRESTDWAWGDVLKSAADQLQELERIKHLIQQRRVVEKTLDLMAPGSKQEGSTPSSPD